MPSMDEVMKLDRELADLCLWDHNEYTLSGGGVGSPTMSGHAALPTAPT